MASPDEVSTKARFILKDQVALLRPVRAKSAQTDTSGSGLISLLLGDDRKYTENCQSLLNANNASLNLSPETSIDTFMRVTTENSKDRLLWTQRLASVDLFTKFYLPFIYDGSNHPSRWQDKPLMWMRTSSHEQPLIRDESLIMLVQCPSIAPLLNTVADICTKHTDALNAFNNERAGSQTPPPGENLATLSPLGHLV